MCAQPLAQIFASEDLIGYLNWPLLSLGLHAETNISHAPDISKDSYLSINFARSQQGQRAIWPIVEHTFFRDRLKSSLATSLSEEISHRVLKQTQEIINTLTWNGSGITRFTVTGELIDITRGVQRESMWSLDHSTTSAFENAVRAVFDLPLGDVTSRDGSWMTLEFSAPHELDMFRPYLHLCARNPRYKFHHFDSHRGVVSLSGKALNLQEDLEHAVEYLEGVIDE